MNVICIDGTEIEVNSVKPHKRGLELHRKTEQSKQSGGKSKSKQQSQQSTSSGQSKQNKQGQSQQSKQGQTKQGKNKRVETVGFVPYDRLMYAIPEKTVHNIDDVDELSTL